MSGGDEQHRKSFSYRLLRVRCKRRLGFSIKRDHRIAFKELGQGCFNLLGSRSGWAVADGLLGRSRSVLLATSDAFNSFAQCTI
jgi:hypothetical protein